MMEVNRKKTIFFFFFFVCDIWAMILFDTSWIFCSDRNCAHSHLPFELLLYITLASTTLIYARIECDLAIIPEYYSLWFIVFVFCPFFYLFFFCCFIITPKWTFSCFRWGRRKDSMFYSIHFIHYKLIKSSFFYFFPI